MASSEIIDYSNHEFFLFKDNKDVLTYESYNDLFHVTNLSFYKEIINIESDNIKRDSNKRSQWEIKYDLEVIKLILSQLISARPKRGINELGTVWKWLAGTPDHDDFIKVQNKMNDLIENNNKQFIINSKLFKEIKSLSEDFKNVFIDQDLPLRKHRLRLLTFDLQNLLDTITLAKIDVFNTKILNNEDIKKILEHEQKPVIIADLMDISVFKIVLHNELLIVYIKYPIINNRCEIFYARSISQTDGKLLISNQVAKCDNTYYEMSTFKKELFNNYCTLSLEKTCFTQLLNGEKSICKKIREKNKKIDLIQDGAIFINGNNIVNNSELNGSFLITFNGTTIINNVSYTNLENKILSYVTTNHFKNYEISDYILSNNSELSLDNINILNPFIKIKNTKISISFILLILIIIYLISLTILKYKNIFLTKKQRPELEKPITEDIFITELRDHLNEIHNESGRSILEGEELSNP